HSRRYRKEQAYHHGGSASSWNWSYTKPSSVDSSIKPRENEREAFAQTIPGKGNNRHRTSSRRWWRWRSRAAERQAAETRYRTRGRS
ncbi:unnamed protein product, partial [Ectocarpus sp. 12 AP-2014]